MRTRLAVVGSVMAGAAVLLAAATPAFACGGLVAPNGTVRLLRTSTLAAYHAGVEHYVTAFKFAGEGSEVGSIVPLPAIPTTVERGGDWTLQRLDRETHPPVAAQRAFASGAASADSATVVYQTRIDALDITVLVGGAQAVGEWARTHGYLLPPDAPRVLEFYARRSRVFMAARFDAATARRRGQQSGDGTPIHLTIPLRNPWVPLRILALGRGRLEPVEADVYLLTDRQPALLPAPGDGFQLDQSAPATASLLDDLRSDKGMGWVPDRMWLSYLRLDQAAGALTYDLAIDVSGAGHPSRRAAGLADLPPPLPSTTIAEPTSTITTAPAPVTTIEPDPPLTTPPSAHVALARTTSSRPQWTALGVAAALLGAVGGAAVVLRPWRRWRSRA